jgi:hypothetical protein
MEKRFVPHNNDLFIQLTVDQVKMIIGEVFQETLLCRKKELEILTIEEVAVLTGYKKATIYKLTHERKIPFHKPAHGGRRIFFKRDEIKQWMQANRIETYEEYFKTSKNN